MTVVLQNAGNILMKTFLPGRVDHRFSIFYGKHAVNIQLGIGIWHGDKVYSNVIFNNIRTKGSLYEAQTDWLVFSTNRQPRWGKAVGFCFMRFSHCRYETVKQVKQVEFLFQLCKCFLYPRCKGFDIIQCACTYRYPEPVDIILSTKCREWH